VAATQEVELSRINRNFDTELERLRLLWAGAPAGSLAPGAANGSKAQGAHSVAAPAATAVTQSR
jgi:hypothetical protein